MLAPSQSPCLACIRDDTNGADPNANVATARTARVRGNQIAYANNTHPSRWRPAHTKHRSRTRTELVRMRRSKRRRAALFIDAAALRRRSSPIEAMCEQHIRTDDAYLQAQGVYRLRTVL